MRFSCFALLFLLPCLLGAQNTDLQGVVRDSTTGQPLAFASVALRHLPDSTVAAHTNSDEQGQFRISGVQAGRYTLTIQLLGYAPLYAAVQLPVSSGASQVWLLTPADQVLQGITVQEKRIPILLNGDTVVYNAEAFPVKENAVAEDLLKKLPGVEVDRQGNIKALGQEVKQVLVDGKPFFGNDPKAATKNLPADAIDQVKVYDKRSDQSTFSGFDDGSGEKVVDIRLKADRRRGRFGRSTIGYGTNQRWSANGMYNQFAPKRQLSLLGSANNVNDAGFSPEEMFQAGLLTVNGNGGMAEGDGESSGGMVLRGGGMGMNGNDDGIARAFATGVNYWQDISPRLAVDGNLMLTGMDNRLEQSLWRQNFYPDSTVDFRQHTLNGDRRLNPRLRMEWDWKTDSFNTLNIKFSGSHTLRSSDNLRDYRFSTRTETPFQTGTNKALRTANRSRLQATLLWKHRFRKAGHTFSAQLQQLTQPAFSDEENGFYTRDTLQQQVEQAEWNTGWQLKNIYTRPLRKRNRFVEMNYTAGYSLLNAEKTTLDADPETGRYTRLNPFLSNDLHYGFFHQQAGAGYRRQRLRYDYSFGAAVQHNLLNAASVGTPDSGIYRHFAHFLPNGNFRLNVGKTAYWRVKLQSGVQAPAARYLLPAADNTNPQVLRLPNARLQPEVRYTAQTSYHNFNMARLTTLLGTMSATWVRHRIASEVARSADGRQIIRPVNTSAGWMGTFFGMWSTPLPNRNFRFSADTRSILNTGYSFLDGQRNDNVFWVKGGGLRISYEKGDALFLEAGVQADHQYNRNAVSFPKVNQFWNGTFQGGGEVRLGKGWRLNTDVSWNGYAGNSTQLNRAFWLVNGSVGRRFLKKEAGFLELAVYDALNQNTAIQRTPGDGYLEEVRNRILQRYVLLRFTYRFLPAGAQEGRPGGVHLNIRR